MLGARSFQGFCLFVLALALISPTGVSAIPNYAGDVVGKCHPAGGGSYNVVAVVTEPSWQVGDLEYKFIPAQVAAASVDHNANAKYFLVPPGQYTVHVGNRGFVVNGSGHQATYTVQASDCEAPRKGLTWSLLKGNPVNGTIRVGCGNACDARNGDTPCDRELPLLCLKKSGSGFPLPVPAHVDDTNRYNRWSGGVVGTTQPSVPPKSLSDANARCVAEFGPGWRVAEHHDGWGWAFQAYGGVGNPDSRFWVDINDTSGTCWK